MKRLTIQRGRAERVLRGHPWVFSNEVEEPPTRFEPGEIVEVHVAGGPTIGSAYVNPRSLILARLFDARPAALDVPFFRGRIAEAIACRERLLPGVTSCRLVYGEGDGLPGLVIDRYGDQLVVQTHTLGMEIRLAAITEAVVGLLAPRAIVERNDVPVRALEGLEPRVGVLAGETDGRAVAEEGGLALAVDLLRGQKTGYFFDQRANRALLAGLSPGRRVLDLFCYVGAWSLAAARAGAIETLGVDTSADALALAGENATRNGLGAVARWERGEVESVLDRLAAAGERFDVVVLDPPAYVKSRKKLFAGLRKYVDVNARAMRAVAPGGFLVTSSCSYHVGAEEHLGALAEAARRAGRGAVVVARGGLPPDHPVPVAAREPDYLTCFVLEMR